MLDTPIDITIYDLFSFMTFESFARSSAKLYTTLKPRLARKFDTTNNVNAAFFSNFRSICSIICSKKDLAGDFSMVTTGNIGSTIPKEKN
jgi:hypothetical protein